MNPKRTGAKASRNAPETTTDRKTLSAGERLTEAEASNSTRKPWKKKSVAEHVLGLVDKLRQEVADKEREYLEAKAQLDRLENVGKALKPQ